MRLSIAWLLVASSACSDGFGAGRSERPPPIDLRTTRRGEACRTYAAAICTQLEACAPFLARIGTGPRSTCESDLVEDCLFRAGLGGSRRDASFLGACAADVRARACASFLAGYPEICPAPAGTLGPGAPCAHDDQCAGLFCARPAESACGTCAERIVEGERCVDRACGAGLVCAIDDRCARPRAIGEPCGPALPCEARAYCDGTCRPRKGVGESCSAFGECDPARGAAPACSVGGTCVGAAIATFGERCDVAADALIFCEAPSRCIAGVCRDGRVEGEACAGSGDCAGINTECIFGRCLRRRAEICQK
jgi:hypothetical protein